MKLTLLLVCFIFGAAAQQMSEHEARAVSDVVKSLAISFITVSAEHPKRETAKAVKVFADNGIAINIQRPEKVAEIAKETIPEFPTVILLRPQHFQQVFEVKDPSKKHSFRLVETRQRLRRDRWYWILLLKPGEELTVEREIPFSVEPIFNGFNIWEQYHIFQNRETGRKTELVRTLMARWFPDTQLENEFKSPGLVVSPRNLFLRRDMKNSTLVIHKCHIPKNMYSDFSHLERFPKFSAAVLEAMQMIFHFKAIFTGKMIYRDIVTCDVTTLHYLEPPTEIWKWVIGPVMTLSISLYYQEPPVRPLESYALEPFEPDVWVALAGWILIAAFCVRLVHLRGKFTMFESIFQVIEAFFGQGNGAEGETTPARLINTAIWLTVIAITASYSAIILTFIMLRKPYVPFNNMEDFVKDGSYNYSGLPFGLTQDAHEMFPEDSGGKEAYRKHRFPNNKWYLSPKRGIQMLCDDPKSAFLMYENHLALSYWPCNLKRMRDPYFISYIGLPSSPIVPYVVAFNEKLPLLRSSGILPIIKKNFAYITFDRKRVLDVPAPGIDLLKYTLMIVPVAWCLSVFILILEVLHKTRLTWKSKPKNARAVFGKRKVVV